MLLDPNIAFEPNGALRRGKHEPLWADIERLAEAAGIGGRPELIWTPLAKTCNEQEIALVSRCLLLPGEGVAGIVYGPKIEDATERFMAITGALVRSYVNARCMMIEEVFRESMEDDGVQATVLLIPDFHTGSMKLPEWKAQAVVSTLHRRLADGQFTFLRSDSPSTVSTVYGTTVARLFDRYFEKAGWK